MTSMLLLFGLGVAVQSPTPRMYQEVQRAVHDAYRKLDDYYERMEVEIKREGELTKVVVEKWIARERYRMAVTVGEQRTMLAGHDGKARWAILFPEKTYMLREEENSLFLSPWKPPVWDDNQPGSVHFSIMEAYDITIDAKPPFALDLFERVKNGTQEEWHCRAITAPSASGGVATVEMWLDASQWVMRRFALRITAPDGVTTIEGRVVDQKFAAGLGDKDFLFPKSEVQGFRKIDFPSSGQGAGRQAAAPRTKRELG